MTPVLWTVSAVFSTVLVMGLMGCALATFLAVSMWRMSMPKRVKNRNSTARQVNTMPMASSVMPKPWGSSRFSLASLVSSVLMKFSVPGVTFWADFTAHFLP